MVEFKTDFSEILKLVEAGGRIAITYGKKREVKALPVPNEVKKVKRKLGVLEGKAIYAFVGGIILTKKNFSGNEIFTGYAYFNLGYS